MKQKPPNPATVNLDGTTHAAETGRLLSVPVSTRAVTMELAKEKEIHKLFEVALQTGKINAIDKLIILFEVENPLATEKDCAQFLRMSVATIKNRKLNPACQRIKALIEGTFSDLAKNARYIGLKRITDIFHNGTDKNSINAYRALEQAAAASEAASAAIRGAGIPVGQLPTTEQAKKLLDEDPAQDDTEIKIEPLD